jgi:hypothetical protein
MFLPTFKKPENPVSGQEASLKVPKPQPGFGTSTLTLTILKPTSVMWKKQAERFFRLTSAIWLLYLYG